MNRKKNLKSRLYYIENLRIFVISLVVLHHLSITYGAPGGWYYVESQAGFPEVIPLTMFVATNQSFFMGMFFFISAFFILPSLNRKGFYQFTRDRLIRLGIPLLIFYFFLSPLTVFIRDRFIFHNDVSFFNYWISRQGLGFGPMWFIEALLLFTIIFLFIIKPLKIKITLSFPSITKILLVAIIIGIFQFVIRIWLPVGWSMPFTNFQLSFFVQYIFFFTIGIIAYQNNWLFLIPIKIGKQMFIFSQVLIFIVMPTMIFIGNLEEIGVNAFRGGLTWQNLTYAIWEQLVGFSLIIGLLALFKKYLNRQGIITKQLSDITYGVYIFHSPILITISAIFKTWEIPLGIKFIVLSPLSLTICFLFAYIVKKSKLFGKII
jgi:glucans biosynthesis protein C